MDEVTLARSHPGWFARLASQRKWQLYRHLVPVVEALSRVARGECKRLLIEMPPRHGKSEFVSKYFPAWWLGTFPGSNVGLLSYSDTFARSWGRKVRDIFEEWGPQLWGLHVSPQASKMSDWEIEGGGIIAGQEAGMKTFGVGGGITGRGVDLLIVDDPIKNSDEANSPTRREKVWDTWLSTVRTRLEPGAAIVAIMTRWHDDDLFGRIQEQAAKSGREDEWEVISLPALAEDNDPLGRLPGEALCPERYDEQELHAIRDDVGAYVWSALFQQRPNVKGGDLFKRSNWRYIWEDELPDDVRWVRAWDKAASDGEDNPDACSTAGVKVGRGSGVPFYISDARAFQLDTGGVRRAVKHTAEEDGFEVDIVMEEEGGSSGKDATWTYRVEVLAAYNFRGVRPTGDKASRWRLVAGHQQFHNVYLVRRRDRSGTPDILANAWIEPYLEAMDKVPRKGKDEADATALGFSELLGNVGTADVNDVPTVEAAMGKSVAGVRSKVASVTGRSAFPMSGRGRRKGW